jgi:hypothetical protein
VVFGGAPVATNLLIGGLWWSSHSQAKSTANCTISLVVAVPFGWDYIRYSEHGTDETVNEMSIYSTAPIVILIIFLSYMSSWISSH